MQPQIDQLKELQEIDSKIATFDAKITREQEVVSDMQQSIDATEDAIRDMQEAIQRFDTEKKEIEAATEDAHAYIKERQGKIMQVQTNREYQSLLKEVEEGKQKNKAREERLLVVLEETETLEKQVADKQAQLEATQKEIDEARKKSKKQIAAIEKTKKKMTASREKVAGKIEASLLSKYELIRSRRNGTAIVAAVNATCQGCFMNIPTQQFNELIRGDRMLTCPTCQRILFHQEPAE